MSRLRVLIVDEADAAERMLRELRRAGFDPDSRRVETAGQMRDALAGAAWDVVLSAPALPAFGAGEALALLAEAEPEVPLLVAADAVSEEGAVGWMRAGARDCVPKRGRRLPAVVERELARHRAERDASRLAEIVGSCADAIVSLTPGGVVTGWNAAAERLFGWPAAEAVGRHVGFLAPPDKLAEQAENLERVRQGERVESPETVRVRRDGTRLDVAVTVAPVHDRAGRLVGASKFVRDITDRKLLEEQYRQSQKMEAVGQLAGGVAHDFNNLLTVISGYSELLLRRLPGGDPVRGLIEEIHAAGERCAGLTRQLLAFSRKQVVAPRVLDLNALVARAEKLLRRVIGEDVSLRTALSPQLPHVRADPGQLEQVLMNLAVNARDAMPIGGTLTIETSAAELGEGHADALPGTYARLAVRDTGAGMSPEVMAHVFEPFFTTKDQGTGLGLAVVHGIVRQAGGHVQVDSAVGAGTTFAVYLPRADRPAPAPRTAPSPPEFPRGTETILLVEDEEGVRSLIRRVLAGCGYRVLEAAGADEALRLAGANRRIDLLLTDVVMPGMGGRKLADRILAGHPEAKVLYLSGYTDDAVVRHGVLYQEVQLLAKPFTPLSLAGKVREVLGPIGCEAIEQGGHGSYG